METTDPIPVQRPKRWDDPLDASMTDADVAWLRTRSPFHTLDTSSFPKATPLDGILRYDCRLRRVEPGEVIVREGDYGNSAFLVITGSVRAMVDSLSQQQLGRDPKPSIGWGEAIRRFVGRSRYPETRTTDQVSINAVPTGKQTIRQIDDHQAVFLQDIDAVFHQHQTVTLGPGELFGEVAAMYRSPRTATVVAETEAALVEIRWQGLRILRRDRQFADTLETHYRRHWLPVHLREIPLLRHVPDQKLAHVIDASQLRSFGRLEWNADYKKTRQLHPADQIRREPIVGQQGLSPTELIIVRSGFGRLCQRYGAAHRTVAYLGKGHLYGLEEIVYNLTRPERAPLMSYQHTLRAVGLLDALTIPVEIFAEYVFPHVRQSELPKPHFADRFAGSIANPAERERRADSEQRQHPRDSPPVHSDRAHADVRHASGSRMESDSLLEFIVQHRLNNGQDAMVIDLHRCTRCDDCVKACGDVHDGNPRFVRQGAVHDRLQFVQACMHCSDPVCMIGCPTGAIARDLETGVVRIHDSICVGCGVCASACPYENISMRDIMDEQGRPYVDQQSGLPIAKATKCDQCTGLPTGPACVAACAHDALVRIDLNESKPLSDWLAKRS